MDYLERLARSRRRNERMKELRHVHKWPLKRIARRYRVSVQRVSKICCG